MGYQAILNHLQADRKANDKQAYADAMTCFSGNLDSPVAKGVFRYLKSGVTCISHCKDVVARVWRKLLDEDAEVAQLWKDKQALFGI